jgi:uncharacterized membrane protein
VSADTSQQSKPREIKPPRASFGEDFKRFFLRGLSALLPTLITLSLLVYVWNFLWDTIGVHIIFFMRYTWYELGVYGYLDPKPAAYIYGQLNSDNNAVRVLGVVLSVLLVYIVGVLVGNLIGRTAWQLAEVAVLRIPLVRAIYPAVKQVTDFLLADRKTHFVGSRVVAVQPHAMGIWSIGLVTNTGHWPMNPGEPPQDMVTVFIPSTPTAFSGYVLVSPRSAVVELPLTVEEAMRLLLSGGVIMPDFNKPPVGAATLAGMPAAGSAASAAPDRAALPVESLLPAEARLPAEAPLPLLSASADSAALVGDRT